MYRNATVGDAAHRQVSMWRAGATRLQDVLVEAGLAHVVRVVADAALEEASVVGADSIAHFHDPPLLVGLLNVACTPVLLWPSTEIPGCCMHTAMNGGQQCVE